LQSAKLNKADPSRLQQFAIQNSGMHQWNQ